MNDGLCKVSLFGGVSGACGATTCVASMCSAQLIMTSYDPNQSPSSHKTTCDHVVISAFITGH